MKKRLFAPYLFISPYVVLSLVFFLYPLIDAVRLAFYQTNGPRSEVFVGWNNFTHVLGDPDFHHAVRNTLVYAFGTLAVQLPLALGLALLLQNSRNKAAGFLRLVLFSPQLTGQIFVGIIFSALFMPRYGLINQALQAIFHWGVEKEWFADPSLVMPALILTSLWMYVGFNMIYFLAALQNVDQSLLEAARVDGANRWQVFRHVTLPAIKPVTVFVVVTSTIGSFQLFELPYALLHGNGPDNAGLTIVGYLYQTAFNAGDLGTGAAIGWLLAFMIFVVSVVQIRLTGSARES